MPKPILTKNSVYPGILLVLVALTIFSTVKSIAFISESINMMFLTDGKVNEQPLKVNTTDYLLVAKKLGLPAK